MWFKKKSALLAEHHYDTEKSANGTTDMRTTQYSYTNNSSSIKYSGLPSVADAGNYFHLPALGYYSSGQLVNVGMVGSHWSSNASPSTSNGVYILEFYSGRVHIGNNNSRRFGMRVGGFE